MPTEEQPHWSNPENQDAERLLRADRLRNTLQLAPGEKLTNSHGFAIASFPDSQSFISRVSWSLRRQITLTPTEATTNFAKPIELEKHYEKLLTAFYQYVREKADPKMSDADVIRTFVLSRLTNSRTDVLSGKADSSTILLRVSLILALSDVMMRSLNSDLSVRDILSKEDEIAMYFEILSLALAQTVIEADFLPSEQDFENYRTPTDEATMGQANEYAQLLLFLARHKYGALGNEKE